MILKELTKDTATVEFSKSEIIRIRTMLGMVQRDKAILSEEQLFLIWQFSNLKDIVCHGNITSLNVAVYNRLFSKNAGVSSEDSDECN